jgi:predicted component of type VI protein secretion system
MEAKLIVVGGKASKNQVALRLPVTIGRSREAGLTIAHPMVSRQHCEIFEADGMLRIRDLGSLNGTFIGERQIIDAPLRPNDEFTVGPLTFRVFYECPADVTAAEPGPPGAVSGLAAEPAPPQAAGAPWGDGGVALPQAPPVAADPPSLTPGNLIPVDLPVPDFAQWEHAQSRQVCEPTGPEPVDLQPLDFEPISPERAPLEPVPLEPALLEPVDLDPLPAEPLEPEPIPVEANQPGPGAVPAATAGPGQPQAPGEPLDPALEEFFRSIQ